MKRKCKLKGNAGAAVIIIQMAGKSFIGISFSHYNMGVTKLLLYSGADLGFTGRITLSIESLKQGVWGAQPLRSHRVFNFV